jgi:hypothetical protein
MGYKINLHFSAELVFFSKKTAKRKAGEFLLQPKKSGCTCERNLFLLCGLLLRCSFLLNCHYLFTSLLHP